MPTTKRVWGEKGRSQGARVVALALGNARREIISTLRVDTLILHHTDGSPRASSVCSLCNRSNERGERVFEGKQRTTCFGLGWLWRTFLCLYLPSANPSTPRVDSQHLIYLTFPICRINTLTYLCPSAVGELTCRRIIVFTVYGRIYAV